MSGFQDHLEIKLHGAPVLNVLLGEVGLRIPTKLHSHSDVVEHRS